MRFWRPGQVSRFGSTLLTEPLCWLASPCACVNMHIYRVCAHQCVCLCRKPRFYSKCKDCCRLSSTTAMPSEKGLTEKAMKENELVGVSLYHWRQNPGLVGLVRNYQTSCPQAEILKAASPISVLETRKPRGHWKSVCPPPPSPSLSSPALVLHLHNLHGLQPVSDTSRLILSHSLQ